MGEEYNRDQRMFMLGYNAALREVKDDVFKLLDDMKLPELPLQSTQTDKGEGRDE